MQAKLCELIQNHIKQCEDCKKEIQKLWASKAGKSKSEAKSNAARQNGKLGGRPKTNN